MLAVVTQLQKITVAIFVSRFQVIRMDFQDIGMVSIPIFHLTAFFSVFEKDLKSLPVLQENDKT